MTSHRAKVEHFFQEAECSDICNDFLERSGASSLEDVLKSTDEEIGKILAGLNAKPLAKSR